MPIIVSRGTFWGTVPTQAARARYAKTAGIAQDKPQGCDHQSAGRRALGKVPLNNLAILSPGRDRPGEPIPRTVYAAEFRRLMKFLAMWVRRHTKTKLIFVAVRHADEDGSRPHLYVLLHLPSAKQREALAVALCAIHGDGEVIDVAPATDKQVYARHALHARF